MWILVQWNSSEGRGGKASVSILCSFLQSNALFLRLHKYNKIGFSISGLYENMKDILCSKNDDRVIKWESHLKWFSSNVWALISKNWKLSDVLCCHFCDCLFLQSFPTRQNFTSQDCWHKRAFDDFAFFYFFLTD